LDGSEVALAPLFAAVVVGWLARRVWHDADPSFRVLLAAIGLWSLASVAEILTPTLAGTVWAAKLGYLGIVTVPPATLWLALRTGGRNLRPRSALGLSLILPPLVTLGLVFTNEWHQAVWRKVAIATGAVPVLDVVYGPAFFFFCGYAHLLLLAAFVAVLRSYRGAQQEQRTQALWVISGIVAPWVCNGIYLLDLSPIPALDLTPIGISVTALAWARGLELSGPLRQLVALARHEIVERLPDAVLVADATGRLVYANAAAAHLLGIGPKPSRQELDAAMLTRPELAVLLRGADQATAEIELAGPTGVTVFEAVAKQIVLSSRPTSQILVLRDVTRRRRAEEQIQMLAHYDALTGLANRQCFQGILEKALKTARIKGERLALLFVDIDRFKQVNDRFGHAVGDQVLRETAHRLHGVIRLTDQIGRSPDGGGLDDDPVSRLGGDEFTVTLRGLSDPLDARHVAQRFLAALESPIVTDRAELYASASIGIAIFPEDGADGEILLQHADTAMYHAKRLGGSRFEYFDPAMNEAAVHRAEVESELRRALAGQEFRIHLQPIWTLGARRLVAGEVLIRWPQADGSMRAPSDFIPIAEESGLISRVGDWVVNQTCAQMAAWEKSGRRQVRIALNVSGHQLRQPEFVDSLVGALSASGVSFGDIELEITETVLLGNDAVTYDSLERLQEIGISLALDDFGTGYSSLSLLKRFAFQRIKIDRSFVAGIPERRDDVSLIRAIVALAHTLGLEVVAEGVETEAQVEFLRSIECDAIQGFLVGAPMAPEEFELLLEHEKDEG